jgi:hypothetical protein
MRSHCFQGTFMLYHRFPLEPRNIAERSGCGEEQEGEESQQILTLRFVAAVRPWIELIDDGYARLGLFVIGSYWLSGGGPWLLHLATFRWSWGWRL